MTLTTGFGLMSTYSYTWPISGVFQLRLQVDALNSVEEIDEQNNSVDRVVVVSEK